MTNTHGPTSDLTQFLSARAIPEVLAEELGVKLIGGAAAAELLGLQSPIIGECIAIPYRGTEYVRVRVLQPDDNGGARYLCPAGMPVPLYVPGATIERAREGQRVIVVESPLKAMAMVAAGFAAVGLGGIGTTLEEGKPNDSWKVYPWTELTVLPDGNARTNPAVARDVARLCAALRCAFGDVRLAQLPADVGDIGPDDFLAQRDADAMKAVLDAAVPADPVARIAAAADRNALLDDACFLAAVEQATHAETASIRDYAKRSFGVRQLNLALGHAKSAARAKAAEGAVVSEVSSGDFGVEDGCLVRYADEGKASVIVHGVIKIVAESVSLDAPDREHYVEIEAWLPDGTSLGQRSIPARDLMAPGVFLREFGSRLRIDAPPYAVLQAIQSASDPRIRFVTSQLGWLLSLIHI